MLLPIEVAGRFYAGVVAVLPRQGQSCGVLGRRHRSALVVEPVLLGVDECEGMGGRRVLRGYRLRLRYRITGYRITGYRITGYRYRWAGLMLV